MEREWARPRRKWWKREIQNSNEKPRMEQKPRMEKRNPD